MERACIVGVVAVLATLAWTHNAGTQTSDAARLAALQAKLESCRQGLTATEGLLQAVPGTPRGTVDAPGIRGSVQQLHQERQSYLRCIRDAQAEIQALGASGSPRPPQ